MKRITLNLCLAALFSALAAVPAIAQNSDGINRVEFFGGFSHNRVASPYSDDDLDYIDYYLETGSAFRDTFGGTYGSNGVNLSVTGNFTKWVGAKFDFATHSSKQSGSFEGFTLNQKYRTTNYLGGIQVKNNKKDGPVAKPFFHALAGVNRQSVTLTGNSVPLVFGENEVKEDQTNFAMAIGGGLDVKVHKNVDIRVFQVDWNPTYAKETDITEGRYQGNIRFGFGIVIH